MPRKVYRTRLVILGDSTVGKTALTQMLTTDGREFPKNYNMNFVHDVSQSLQSDTLQAHIQPVLQCPNNNLKDFRYTLGVDVNLKQISVPGTEDSVEFLIYDSTGLDLYRDCLTKYWDSPSLLIIVYDVTLQSSFESVHHWLEIALGTQWPLLNNRPYTQVLVANKIDLLGRRFVSEDIGKKLAEKYNFHYFETSAKDNQGVEEIFSWLAKEWHNFVKNQSTENCSSNSFDNPFSKSAFRTSTVF